MHPTEQFLHALIDANPDVQWEEAYLTALRDSMCG